jgi:putative ABC transport system permease protein
MIERNGGDDGLEPATSDVTGLWSVRIIGDPPGAEIVGVVKDSRFAGLRKAPGPMLYDLALRGEPDQVSALEVRTAGDPAVLSHAAQEEVRRINPRLLVEVRTMRQEVDRAIAQERMVAAASAFFSALGLVLACVGLFGVASYTVPSGPMSWASALR